MRIVRAADGGMNAGLLALAALALPGCAAVGAGPKEVNILSLQQRALDCVKLGIQYRENPVVRVQAIDALESCQLEEGRPWVRAALLDEHPGVRFAACLAVATSQDELARTALTSMVDDPDAGVRVAVRYALHTLGDDRLTGEIPPYLLSHEDPAVRRNAALVLGRFGKEGVVKVLARAMKDKDPMVQLHALEAMARLGNKEARQQLRFMANSGLGSEEVLAIVALAQTKDLSCTDLYRYKLETGMHIESRLAAAYGLGVLQSKDGFDVALRGLSFNEPRKGEPDDPPADQIVRARQLAAKALGAIGDTRALPALEQMMNEERDPRLQVAAGKAILEICEAERARSPMGVLPRTVTIGR